MAGLPWIKVSVDLPRHPKSQRLAARLDDPRAWTYVVQLWAWIAEFEATGEVQGVDSALLVARGAGWAGDAEVFCRAMVAVGFLDTTPDGLAVHDWKEWAGAHVEKKHKDAKRQAKRRASSVPSRGQSEPRHADVRVTDDGRHAVSRAESSTQRGESRDGRSETTTEEAPPPRERAREAGAADREAIVADAASNDTLPLTLAVLKLLHAAGKTAAAPSPTPRVRRRDEQLLAEVGVELAAARVLAAWNPAKATLGWYADDIAARPPRAGQGRPPDPRAAAAPSPPESFKTTDTWSGT